MCNGVAGVVVLRFVASRDRTASDGELNVADAANGGPLQQLNQCVR
jgi:hypothetical protein